MADDPATPARPLSDAEAMDFRELGLTPGHWVALAPLPLLCARNLRRADVGDFDSFRQLAEHLPGEEGRPGEAEEFWTRHANFSPPPWALGLLGWHLAHRAARAAREAYLAALDEAAADFFPQNLISPARPDTLKAVREVIEAALGHREYAHHLPPSRLTDRTGEPPAAAELGGRLLAGPIESVLRVLARGLAGLYFLERYELLRSLGDWVRKCVRGAEGDRLARQLVDRLRELVEDVLRASGEPPPGPATNAVGPPSIDARAKPPSPAPAARGLLSVELASGFTPVTLTAALVQASEVTVPQVREWLANPENARGFLFDGFRDECREVAIVRDPAAVPKSLWVVGDIHADVLTLANVIARADRVAEREGEPAAFLFLGDFVDRGRHDHETLLLLFKLILRDPSRVCVIPGNHDIDLKWDEGAGRFRVSIEPAEYCERLNRLLADDHPAAAEEVELAKLLIDFWNARPKAVVLPDGTMFSHGGFPHTDLHASLTSLASLGEKRCLDDFLWARLAESPKKRPNRGNRGHEFGWRDFAAFCRVMTDVVKVPVARLVRGHDHVPSRWLLPGDYADFPVLTINAMGRRMDGEPDPADGPHPFPVVARHVPGELPRLVRLPLDPAEVEKAFGKEQHLPPASAFDPLDNFPGGVPIDAPRAESDRGAGV